MKNFTMSARFAAGAVLLISLTIAVILTVTINKLESSSAATEQMFLESRYQEVVSRLQAEGSRGQSLSQLVAGIPQVQKAFANQDREQLAEFFVGGFAQMKKEYGVRQFQFHLPPATSFLRVHKPKKFGDDLSSFRHTVTATNQSKQPVSGLEIGVAGLGIRGIVPVVESGKHIGSVEFGISFGQSFFDEFKMQRQTDLALYLKRDNGFQRFGSTMGETKMIDEAGMERAFSGETVTFQSQFNGKSVAIYARPLLDYSGKAVGVLELVSDRSFFSNNIAEVRSTILFYGFLALLLALFSAIFIGRKMSLPLQNAAASLEAIASGASDLDTRLPVTGAAEMQRLAVAFNCFAESFQKTMTKVASAASKFAGGTEEFSRTIEHTRQAMEAEQQQTEQIATAVNQLSSTVHEVASNTAQAVNSAEHADSETEQGQLVVSNTIETINQVAIEVSKISDMVERVNASSQQIDSVLDVIVSIAEQTNLLALNAAIEAARAGEQGRGFAVVADEVRSLAQRTQNSTEEIQQTIRHLQQNTDQAVAVFGSVTSSVDKAVSEAGLAGEALQRIHMAVNDISLMNTQIATASEEQSVVTDEINEKVTIINDLSMETVEEARQSSIKGEQLLKWSDELMAMVGEFKLGGSSQLFLDLEKAKSAHAAWKVRVRGLLDGRESLSMNEAVSDHDCAFGLWYFGEGKQQFAHIAEMKQIEEPHHRLHKTIRQIIEYKEKGKVNEAEVLYREIELISDQIVNLIDQVQIQVTH